MASQFACCWKWTLLLSYSELFKGDYFSHVFILVRHNPLATCFLARLLEWNSRRLQPGQLEVQLHKYIWFHRSFGGWSWLTVNYCTYKAILLDMPNQLLLQQHLQKPAAHFWCRLLGPLHGRTPQTHPRKQKRKDHFQVWVSSLLKIPCTEKRWI